MLNFAERTGSGAVILVWSFLQKMASANIQSHKKVFIIQNKQLFLYNGFDNQFGIHNATVFKCFEAIIPCRALQGRME